MVIDWTINPGYLITIASMTGGLIYTLGRSKRQLEEVAKKVEDGSREMAKSLDAINQTLGKHAERDAEFNASSRVMEQRMATVEAELTRTRDALTALTGATYLEAMRIVKAQKTRGVKDLAGSAG